MNEIKPEPPKLVQNIVWIWLYGWKYWKILLIAALVVIAAAVVNSFFRPGIFHKTEVKKQPIVTEPISEILKNDQKPIAKAVNGDSTPSITEQPKIDVTLNKKQADPPDKNTTDVEIITVKCNNDICEGYPNPAIDILNTHLARRKIGIPNRQEIISRWVDKYKTIHKYLKDSSRGQSIDAGISLEAGMINTARNLIGELIDQHEYPGTGYEENLYILHGDLSWLLWEPYEVIEAYKKATHIGGTTNDCYTEEYAESLEAVGQRDKAIIARKRMIR